MITHNPLHGSGQADFPHQVCSSTLDAYVVSPVMWRRADNALAWLVVVPAHRHIRESL